MPIPKNMLIFYTHPIELFSYWPKEKLWKLHFLLSVCNTVSSSFLVGLFVNTRKMSFGDMALPEPFMLSWHGPWAREANIITKPSHNTIALHVTCPDLTCPLEQTNSCIYDVHAYMCVCSRGEKKMCWQACNTHSWLCTHTGMSQDLWNAISLRWGTAAAACKRTHKHARANVQTYEHAGRPDEVCPKTGTFDWS